MKTISRFILIMSLLIPLTIIAQQEYCFECEGNSSKGYKSSSFGIDNRIEGNYSCGFGQNNRTIGLCSSVFGADNFATGEYSFVAGKNSSSLRNFSAVIGSWSIVNGLHSFIIGSFDTVSVNSGFVFGNNSKVQNTSAILIGHYLQSLANNAFIIGNGLVDNPLTSNKSYSLSIGFKSNKPTFFVSETPYGKESGYVGIGNITSPTAKLHIRADAGDSATLRLEPGSGKVSRIYFSNTNDYYVQAANNQNMVFNTPSGKNFSFNIGNVGIGVSAPTEKLEIAGNIKTSSNGYLITNKVQASGTAGLSLYGTAGAGIIVLNSGYVGIGATTPLERLEVNGNIKQTAGFSLKTSTVLAADANGLKLYSNSNSGIFITNNGFVGIGTTTGAIERLEVNGNIKQTAGYNLFTSVVKANDVNGLKLYNSSNNGIVISNNGDVGVGVAVPGKKLDVAGTVKATGFIGNGAELTNVPGDNLGNHLATQNIKLAGKWLSGDGDNEGIFISSDGKIGSGTSSPGARLELADFGNPGSKYLIIGNDVYLTDIDEANTLGIYGNQDSTRGAIVLGRNGPKLWGFADNLGIGTTPSSGYKLSVAGKMRCTEVVVEALPWSDYVFEEGYKLMPIKELELYILTNKHLPDIPVEKTVSEQGLSIGEMNAQLLKKVEELTLYIIEQQKVLENQQNEIEKIRAMISK